MFLEAELMSLKETKSALSPYICCIALSRESGFLWQTALASERTGKYMVLIGELDSAPSYLQEAVQLYKEWGSPSKATTLEEEIMEMNLDN